MPTGKTSASDYQHLVYELLNLLFEPELTDGELEVDTYRKTERRDIIYTNEAETSFFNYIRLTYSSLLVMFETKNKERLEIDDINQTATYLGVRLGMFGIIVTRNNPGDNIIRKTFSIYNDSPSTPRKIILILCDSDIHEMIRLKHLGINPVKHIQRLYRSFRQRVQ